MPPTVLSAFSLILASIAVVGRAKEPVLPGMQTDAIAVEVTEPRCEGDTVVVGPIHVRMKDEQAPGIRRLYCFVIDDKNANGVADEGEALVGSEQPYSLPCPAVSYSFRAKLDRVENERLGLAWRVEFGEDGRASGYLQLQQP